MIQTFIYFLFSQIMPFDDFSDLSLFVFVFIIQEGQAIRVSFSNMFKEFKSTATWLQFPFLCGAAHASVYENTASTAKQGISHLPFILRMLSARSKRFFFLFVWLPIDNLCISGLVGPAPPSTRWTCLTMDLRHVLSVYLNRTHSHLKSIKLCANMTVKNIITSDLLFDPGRFLSLLCMCGFICYGCLLSN